jgi:hypothetical protein
MKLSVKNQPLNAWIITAFMIFPLVSCHYERTCSVKEVWADGGADAFVPWWQTDGSTNPNCPVTNACGGCSVLATEPGLECGSCGGEFVCDGEEAVRCADPCMDLYGCADGEREAFTDATAFPDVAGCSGAWTTAGILDTEPVCGRDSGDDSGNPNGISCSAADLCAEGWGVCTLAELAAASPTVGCDATDIAPDTFFAAAVSGPGDEECAEGETDDLFGCGTVGLGADAATCAPLNRSSGDKCDDLPGVWDCPGEWYEINSHDEAQDVRKTGPSNGGVLCCRILGAP